MTSIATRNSLWTLVATWIMVGCHVQAASFDCTKAVSQVEHLICDTPALSQADETLAAAYRVALTVDPSVRERQLNWLRMTRNRCSDVQCLMSAYQTQIEATQKDVPAAIPASGAQENPAQLALQLACPPDWSALADIDGSDPERSIFGLKAREWRKEHLDMVLAKTQECLRASNVSGTVRKAKLTDIQTRDYPSAVAAIERRDQRLQLNAQRSQVVAQPNAAESKVPVELSRAPQSAKREATANGRDTEVGQQARNAEAVAQRKATQNRDEIFLIGGGILAAIVAAWIWNKFIRNRCPNCRSTKLDNTDVSEVDRWRGTKQVTEQHSRGSRTRHVSTTFVKNAYIYRCRECSAEWVVEKKQEK